MSWIITRSGRKFDLLDPKPQDVVLSDIAHALAHQCRFAGHTRTFYSVAYHSYLTSYAVGKMPGLVVDSGRWMIEGSTGEVRRMLELEALLHDAHEAYCGDIPSPLRVALADRTSELESIIKRIDEVIRLKFHLPNIPSPRVAEADRVMLATERRDVLAAAHNVEWPSLRGVRPLDRPIKPMTSERSEVLFYRRYFELTGDRGSDHDLSRIGK